MGPQQQAGHQLQLPSWDAVGAAGACKADIKALCKDVSPGDDRVLLCLVKRIKQAVQGNTAGGPCPAPLCLMHAPSLCSLFEYSITQDSICCQCWRVMCMSLHLALLLHRSWCV